VYFYRPLHFCFFDLFELLFCVQQRNIPFHDCICCGDSLAGVWVDWFIETSRWLAVNDFRELFCEDTVAFLYHRESFSSILRKEHCKVLETNLFCQLCDIMPIECVDVEIPLPVKYAL